MLELGYRTVGLPSAVGKLALHFEATTPTDEEPREAFFFREGAVIFWNVPAAEAASVRSMVMKRAELSSYDTALVDAEAELLSFQFSAKPARIASNSGTLFLEEKSPPEKNDLIKYAFSNALGLSTKLAVWEWRTERFIKSTEKLSLQDAGKLRRRDIMQLTGALYRLRHQINLSSNLLDTPDVYWEWEWLESIYLEACRYLSIQRRVSILNEKLDHCSDLLALHRDDRNNASSRHIEICIVLLIAIEIVFESLHYWRSRQAEVVVTAPDAELLHELDEK